MKEIRREAAMARQSPRPQGASNQEEEAARAARPTFSWPADCLP